jgi:threonine dehydratase
VNTVGSGRIPTLEGIRDAAALLAASTATSPMFRSVQLSRELDATVWLKVESVNSIGSFKGRGATTAITRAMRARPSITEIVTSSTGNHGQGVALASSVLGIPCRIFMPATPNPVKRAMIAALGATVELTGDDLDATKVTALAYAAERGALFVDDGENVDVMEGAGTVGLEIAERLESVDEVFLPMGSGTFASGVATALRGVHPAVRITGVQSAESPAMTESFRQRRAVELPARSIADGLECRVPAALALDRVLALLDEVIAVPDATLLRSIRTLLEVQHLVVEPAGAAALAGAAAARDRLAGRTVVLVCSGANLTPAILGRVLDGPGLF